DVSVEGHLGIDLLRRHAAMPGDACSQPVVNLLPAHLPTFLWGRRCFLFHRELPLTNYREFAGQVTVSHHMSLNLAAGGLGERSRLDEHQGVERDLMLRLHSSAHGLRDGIEVEPGRTNDLLHDDEPLAAVLLDGEGSSVV